MKRYQTTPVNCFSTCIANILYLTDEELNNLPQHHENEWFEDYQKALKKHGYQIICNTTNDLKYLPDIICIITGESPYTKNSNHSVIGRKDKILFDPKPEGLGILGDFTEWEFCYLIPIFYKNK